MDSHRFGDAGGPSALRRMLRYRIGVQHDMVGSRDVPRSEALEKV